MGTTANPLFVKKSAEHIDIESRLDGTSADTPTGVSVALGDCTACQIVYQDLRFSVQVKEKGKKETTTKEILKGLDGVINPGRLTAVMGASGAGKTTFLNVLAGYQKDEGSARSGQITVNGQVMEGNMMRRISGFVHQEDVILDTMTVREALLFAAELKLPKDMPHDEKVRRAMDIADLLNLRKALDSMVGSALIKGISGGEKRRLSLGMEMITNPAVLYLDEPTSGLDSYTAYKVARILRNVAHKYGRTIVCTIHQPSSEVFNLFDDIIVLAEGQVLYHGEVPDMVPYFASLGYPCPNNFNPADFLFMDVLYNGRSSNESSYDFIAGGGDESSKQKAKEVESARLQGLLDAWHASSHRAALHQSLKRQLTQGVHESAILSYASVWAQLWLLSQRAARNMYRNPLILKGKLAQTVFLSIIVGLTYLRLDSDTKGVQDRQGSLFFIIVQGLFGSVMGTLTVFGAEKAVFQREFSGRYYSLPAYFVSRTVTQLPLQVVMPVLASVIMYWMIGYQNTADKFGWFVLILVLMDNCGAAVGVFVSSIFNDINIALTIMPMFLLPLMVFSGFFVNSDNLGWWFRWIVYISPMKYGFVALAKNEFSGLEISCTPGKDDGCSPQGTRQGEDVIDQLSFTDEGSIGQNAGILFALMWGFYLMAFVALWAAVRRARM